MFRYFSQIVPRVCNLVLFDLLEIINSRISKYKLEYISFHLLIVGRASETAAGRGGV